MPYRLTLQAAAPPSVTVHLPEALVRQPAIETIMALADPSENLVADGWLQATAAVDLTVLQARLFAHDEQGAYVRDGIDLLGPDGSLDPDRPLHPLFRPGADGLPSLTVRVVGPHEPVEDDAAAQAEQMTAYQVLYIRHHLGKGGLVDVTKDDPFLKDALGRLEKAGELTIDVERASWALSAAGQAAFERQRGEALDLIRRYDIFADVDARFGEPKFGSGIGDDWRVAAYESERVDPFRARFVIGLNDGEWDGMADWAERIVSPDWYDRVFEPISTAPGVADVGEGVLKRVIEAGSRIVRETLDEERRLGIDPAADRLPNPYRDGTLRPDY